METFTVRRCGAALLACLLVFLSSAHAQDAAPSRLQTSLTTRTEFAFRLNEPRTMSKLRQYVYLRGKYPLSQPEPTPANITFHFTLRGYYDGVFDLTNHFPPNVEEDEESEVSIREAVLAVRAGRWDLRIGRQQVVWGEAVGLFFADVVNPKDLREFLLRDFDDLRVSLWGVDALYEAGKDRVLEIFWSPEVRFSKLPTTGAEFEFFVPPPPLGSTSFSFP